FAIRRCFLLLRATAVAVETVSSRFSVTSALGACESISRQLRVLNLSKVLVAEVCALGDVGEYLPAWVFDRELGHRAALVADSGAGLGG
ncbi:hypothetical protein PMAYCL1PPCAC_14963, partial [Pristionchus mayeri]